MENNPRETIDQYLDRVCRGIRGPRALRQHIRRELAEHLTDAIARHRDAGMTDEQALERALADFGGPEQVGSELEEQYGHRLMGVVIDKAIEWKEKTMKARWLWTTWAHVALTLLIAFEVSLIAVAMLRIAPAYVQIRQDGLLVGGSSEAEEFYRSANQIVMGSVALTDNLVNYWYLYALFGGGLWAAFEWRVHSENKSLVRLSAMGMIALGSAVWSGVLAAALVVAFVLAMPRLYVQLPEPIVREQVVKVEQAVVEAEQALARGDWKASRDRTLAAERALDPLDEMGGAAPALIALDQQARIDEVRENLRSAGRALHDAQNAMLQENAAGASAALAKFRRAYAQVPGVPPREKL